MSNPPNWPRCRCGAPVLDGYLTCGRAECGREAQAAEMHRRSDQMADELLGLMKRHGPMELLVNPTTALTLAALLQLASRHTSLTMLHRTTIDSMLMAIRVYFASCPMTLEALRMGDDPAYDIRPEDQTTCEILTIDGMSAIKCRFCDSLSVLPADVEHRYCARCHLFHAVVAGVRTMAADGHAHECGEWRTARGHCAICGRHVA
jgi:hypothetical protein